MDFNKKGFKIKKRSLQYCNKFFPLCWAICDKALFRASVRHRFLTGPENCTVVFTPNLKMAPPL
jgi:hypothetical protein